MLVTRTMCRMGLVGAVLVGFVASSFAQGKPAEKVAPSEQGKAAKPGAPSEQGKATKPAVPSEKVRDIRRLIEVSGAVPAGLETMRQMVALMRVGMPQVPHGYWDAFEREIRPSELADAMVPVVDRQLSADEIKQIIAFYETPAGKKLARVMPLLAQDAMQASIAWGARTGHKVRTQIQPSGH